MVQDVLALSEITARRRSFTEVIEQVPARARTTARVAPRAIGAAIGDAAARWPEVADAHGVSWPTAHRAFIATAGEQLKRPALTPALGIDETRRGKPAGSTTRHLSVDAG
ncbi:hypothetical protein [Mycobacterium riyadhense]|uniref:hypothetical protein n=1 Tax=Mycobacterium riyadhense TaxID=486698 RepID=UPI00195AFB8C|nr:hypothetical protein [Mycobacterium riyadhense]